MTAFGYDGKHVVCTEVTEALLPRIPRGGAVVSIASAAGGGWQSHQSDIVDLLDTSNFDAGVAWCDAHLDDLGGTYEQIGIGRPGDPAEMAGAMLFLGSDEASYVNGHNLYIDGGFQAALATGQIDVSKLV